MNSPKTGNKQQETKSSIICFLLLVSLLLLKTSNAQYDAARYPVIPKPYSLLPFSGKFMVNEKTVLVTDNRFYKNEIEYFRQEVKKYYGIELKYVSKKVSSNFIYISEDSTDIPSEGYNLFVNRNEINLYGGHAGIFYGLQTLFQLLGHHEIEYDKDSNITTFFPHKYYPSVPSCSIIDQPRFAWRGMHLDVSRHFFPKDSVREFLRYMAMYKLNTFHWHLTDDQGWRIEIKKYPKLTSVGAWRDGTLTGHEGANDPPVYDNVRYGGFYTQDDIREIIKLADSLHITIVPEIEMPGHSLAMLAAYPELACSGKEFKVSQTWGVFDDVLCPAEETFTFLDNVLTEVAALFPGKYIHIGGDECPKARWKESAYCQELMKKNDLQNEEQLQSWFTQRIVKMLQAKGKQAIGWDEILEGGLADGAAVMSWRGEEGGIAAAKAKHNVVMSPGGYCYFDHYQSQSPDEPLAIGGFLPIQKVYSYDPVPASLNADEKKYIMGVQANVWTEYIPAFSQVQYMIFPRMAALAEVAWCETANKNFDFFMERLQTHLQLLDQMKIHYAKSIFEIHYQLNRNPGGEGLLLSLSTLQKNVIIKYNYTQNDTEVPKIYAKPVPVYSGIYFYSQDQSGRMLSHGELHFDNNLAFGKNITLRKPPSSSYNTGGDLTLVDGIKGRTPWIGSEWLGFSGDTLDVIIDLGKTIPVSEVSFNYLHDHGSWIYAPSSVKVMVSDDGKNFRDACIPTFWHEEDNNGSETIPFSGCAEKARYVRLILIAKPKISGGYPGEGNPAWLFVSEIEIK